MALVPALGSQGQVDLSPKGKNKIINNKIKASAINEQA